MATLQTNFLSMRLGMQTNVTVFLPSTMPGPAIAGKTNKELYPRGEKFKTLWLLGTEYGDDSELLKYSNIISLAEKYRFAVVFPCVYERLYSNDPKGQKFTDYIFDELFKVCTCLFSLSDKREDNYIGGISFGAYGAAKCAFAAPDVYSKLIMINGVYEKNIKAGYIKALTDKMIADGVIPHHALEWADDIDAELLLKGEGEKPSVWTGYSEKYALASYSKNAAANLKADGFKTEEKVYSDEDDWSLKNKALEDAAAWMMEV